MNIRFYSKNKNKIRVFLSYDLFILLLFVIYSSNKPFSKHVTGRLL